MSVAVENFVKAIYANKRHDHKNTKPGTIAKKLNISSAAATDMAKKLADKGLLEYEKYQELKLTDKGTKMALTIVRKHRLWESFLFKLFDMNLHDIHREAELLEHQTSDYLANAISAYLGNPKFDPHGDPIPNANGEITTTDNSIALSAAKEGKTYTISRLMSDDKDFFEFCSQNKLKYGHSISIIKQFNTTQMTQIMVENNTIVLNQEFSNTIYVTQKN